MHLKIKKKQAEKLFKRTHPLPPRKPFVFVNPPPLPKNEMKKMPALVGLMGFIFEQIRC